MRCRPIELFKRSSESGIFAVENKPAFANFLETSAEPLSKLHVIGLTLLLVVVILFGAMVEFRGALTKTHMTDIGPYLRAAWSVRTGGDMYKITDDRGFHYVYPPVFAILMTPLADPPHGEDRKGYLPYEASVGIWYVITMALGLAGIAILARTVEDPFRNLAAGRGRRFSQRWWALRTAPMLILLPAIGRSQMRGQVGLLIVFFLCCVAASILKGRRFRAGLWLSAAICVKLIPAILLTFALWRRDWRMLSGSAAGLLVGLILVPLIVLGPGRTASSYKTFYKETVLAGINGEHRGSRGRELTGITSTDSNSPMVVLNNIMYPDRNSRPKVAHPGVRAAHWTIAFVLLAITLLASGWKGRWYSGRVDATISEVSFISAFIPLMFVTSPVFHPHYVSMAVPLVMILLVILWERYSYGNIPSRWKALFWFIAVSHLLSSVDRGPFLHFRDFGLVLLSTVTLWLATLTAIRQTALVPFISEIPMPKPSQINIEKVAVVLPAFNEREVIGRAVESAIEFSAHNPNYHFLFVDDGSTDGTFEVLKKSLGEHRTGNVSFTGYETNKGKGHAIRTGFEMMEADAYCFMDADMAYSTDYLKVIREKLEAADIVIGSRSLFARMRGELEIIRALLGTSLNWIVRSALGLPFRDTQAGMKGFRREAAKYLFRKSNVSGFSFDAEILFLARKRGFWVEEFEVRASSEHEYKGGWRLPSMSLAMFRDLLHIIWRNFKGLYD
jgi:hypothetical protein